MGRREPDMNGRLDSRRPTTLGDATSRITPVGLCVQGSLRFDEWASLGKRLARVAAGTAWSLGDWLVYGEAAFGTRYRTALDTTQLDYQTLRNLAWVARAFDMSRRRDKLSFAHHAEVAALSQPEQELWLTRAEVNGWSRNELRRRLAAQYDRHSRPTAPSLHLQVSVERERRWREAAAAREQPLTDWIARELDAAAEAALRAPGGPAAIEDARRHTREPSVPARLGART